jgi:hypothetical protein
MIVFILEGLYTTYVVERMHFLTLL